MEPWTEAIFAAGTFAYLVLVSKIRGKRAIETPCRYSIRRREDFTNLTVDDAQAILKDLTELEFPKVMGLSIVFAIFKVRIHSTLISS